MKLSTDLPPAATVFASRVLQCGPTLAPRESKQRHMPRSSFEMMREMGREPKLARQPPACRRGSRRRMLLLQNDAVSPL